MDLNNWQQSIQSWVTAFLICFGTFFGTKLFFKLILKRLAAWSQLHPARWSKLVVFVLQETHSFFFLVLSVGVSAQFLTLSDRILDLVEKCLLVAVTLQVGLWGDVALKKSFELSQEHNPSNSSQGRNSSLHWLKLVARIVLFGALLLTILQTIGINITALIAGLGVGGVAIALAVQNILGDVFASLSIVLDRPFEIGDFIVVGDHKGTIEKIGLKTTRVRSLSGEQLIFPNSDLLQSRIQNYKRMSERRISFTLQVTYQTPPKLLREIPDLVRKIVQIQTGVRWERTHFSSFSESALQIETVYWVLSPDYNTYMDIQQNINLSLLETFEERGIQFAHPTRTLVIKEDATNFSVPSSGRLEAASVSE
jgi:small-conductance mechanosensitive channel